MQTSKAVSRSASLLILFLVPVTWWVTVADWDAEVAGLYSFARAAFNVLVTAAGFSVVYILSGTGPVRPRLQAVALGFSTAFVCLLLLEVPALFFGFNFQKVFGSIEPDTALHLSGGVNRPDPVLIHIHWPHSSFSGDVAGNLAQLGIPAAPHHPVSVSYDHNGFRNDTDYEQADIAVIGDSFVEAAIVAREESLVGLLASRLQRPVVNLGQIAYGFRQELEVLKRFALPLSPRLVVWVVFGGNDLRDVEWYEQQLVNFGKAEPPVPLRERLFSRNMLVAAGAALDDIVRGVFDIPTSNALDHSGLFSRADGVTERVYFGQSADPWNAHQWEVATSTLQEALHLSQQGGAEFVVVYIPRKFRIYKDHLQLASGTAIAKWEVNNLPEALGSWCAANGMHFLDLTPHLARHVQSGIHPYFTDDVHWNPLGHETAASAIADYLSREKIFPF